MTDALILFVRTPELGKVKTRIAAAAGAATALQVYQKLLQHTYNITVALPCDKYVFYADALGHQDLWSGGSYSKAVQPEGDLGSRMQFAFNALFDKGYQRICIIGSDCLALHEKIITQAFQLLHQKDIVIGPATDGGYYLLGMRKNLENIFENIWWSTDKVLEQTIAAINTTPHTFSLLQPLNDIDTVDDIPETWKEEMLINLQNK